MDQKWIHGLIEVASKQASKTAVFVVANVSDNQNLIEVSSRENEHFNETELLEIINGFRDFGLYCDYFIGEEDFVRWVSGGGPKHLPFELCLIYNTAQSGTGPGRKSLVPAYCDLHDILRLNSNAYTASLARHKFHTHCVLSQADISTPETWWFLPDGNWFGGKKPRVGQRVITKSTYESASIGVSRDGIFDYNNNRDDWLKEMTEKLNQGVVVQELVDGWEVETPIIVNEEPRALKPVCTGLDGLPKMGCAIFDFHTVNKEKYCFFELPEEVEHTNRKCRETAEFVARTLGIEGFGRVDFRIGQNGIPKVIDVSTTPHLVRHSSFAYRFKQMGYSDAELFGTLVGAYL